MDTLFFPGHAPDIMHQENEKIISAETIGEIAAKDLRKAEVFKNYGIDFCCGGKRSLKQACDEKGIDTNVVEAALENAKEILQPVNDYNRWQPDFLSDYIYNQHHIYYYNEMPVINELMEKVTSRHGDHYPELAVLAALFIELTTELDAHFVKEEKILFPFIKALVKAKEKCDFIALSNGASITEPIQMMVAEHERAGELLGRMEMLTDNYTPPADACNSFLLLYKKLNELDEDLHQHIHLENNLLFPKALACVGVYS